MLTRIVDFIKASKPAQFAVVFVAGGVLASALYPTKHIEQRLQKTFEQQISVMKQQHQQELDTQQSQYKEQLTKVSTLNEQLNNKVSDLSTQVTTLKMHQKKTFYKIVHPDGTVEERASTTTDSTENEQVSQQIQQEYQANLQSKVTEIQDITARQIATMQKEFDSKEQDYQKQIATLTQSKIIDINPKNFTLDVGVLTNLDYYGHITYNIFGPFVLGIQGQFGTSSAAGIGAGLRF